MKKKTIIIIVSILTVLFGIVSFFAIRSIPKQVKEVEKEVAEKVTETNEIKGYISLDDKWIKENKKEIKRIFFANSYYDLKNNIVNVGGYKAYFSEGTLNICVPEQTILKNNLTNMFKDWEGLEEIGGLNVLDLSEITSLNGTFQNSGVRKVDFSGTNLSNLISAENTFADCKDLVEVYMPGTMSSLKNTKGMFKNCFSAEKIDLRDNHFYLNDASYMFYCVGANFSCDMPTTFYIDNVNNAAFMFASSRLYDYQGLADHIKTNNTTDMTSMFESIQADSLNLSSWNVENVKTMNGMFFDSSLLNTLDTSNWSVNKLESCSEIFSNCSGLTVLKMNWKNVDVLKNVDSMFSNCASLEEIDVSFLDGKNLFNADYMFEDCIDLKNIYGKGFLSFTSFDMFKSCLSLDINLYNGPSEDGTKVIRDGSMAQSVNGYFKERKINDVQ